jgi:uncharacterized damage-inducible protein DinB
LFSKLQKHLDGQCFNKNIIIMGTLRTQAYIQELTTETRASRKCLESIPEKLFEYKPHPRSMNMGYLALLVAGIPGWIKYMIEDGEIDLGTFKQVSPASTAEMVKHFDENVAAARKALEKTTDEALESLFTLKRNGEVLYQSPKIVDIGTTLNHWVHHRGQLTVYMRLNEIAVPSIYGPSADDRTFTPPS